MELVGGALLKLGSLQEGVFNPEAVMSICLEYICTYDVFKEVLGSALEDEDCVPPTVTSGLILWNVGDQVFMTRHSAALPY